MTKTIFVSFSLAAAALSFPALGGSVDARAGNLDGLSAAELDRARMGEHTPNTPGYAGASAAGSSAAAELPRDRTYLESDAARMDRNNPGGDMRSERRQIRTPMSGGTVGGESSGNYSDSPGW